MKRSIVRQNTNDAGVKPFQYELSLQPVPTIEFLPSEIVRHKTASWRGIQAKTVQVISLEPFEYRFKQQGHLLIAIEQGVRHEGETFLEGLPKTTIRHYSNTLIFVPVGRTLFGVQTPRLLPRSICLYIDPQAVLVDPDLRFAEVELQPRLLFEDRAIWETVLKLKAQIGSDDPTDRMYADSLGGVLAHELLRLNGNIQSSRGSSPGGLATWQQRSGMNTITAAAGEYSAIISGGARASDVVAVTDPLGLAVVTGSVGAVGVAGLTLGGYGPLIGRFGLALDNLVAAEVVLADGRIVIADRDSEEELFWALRGGGGNFGVVTSMNHRLHRVPSVHSGLLFYPFSEARSVLQACAEIANSASDELTAQVGCVGGLDGPMVFVWVTWCGLPAEGEKRVAPFLNLGP